MVVTVRPAPLCFEVEDTPGIPLPVLTPGGWVMDPQVWVALACVEPEPTGIADAALSRRRLA